MSKLTEKGKGINFDDVDSEERQPPPVHDARPRTAIGAISASLALGRGVEAENRQLKARLERFEDATFVEFIDPEHIVPSRYANRHELSFAGQEFADLKAQIAQAGRNIQPIKLRRVGAEAGRKEAFEIVFGHRRHRACLELGIPVVAIVEEVSDVELFAQMDRENRDRENLSPWEQGTMYKRALDLGLFASQRQLASAVGAQSGNVSTAIQLASLPSEIVAAFASPLDIQYRWGAELKAALERDPEGMRARAAEVAATSPRPNARETLARLVAIGPAAKAPLLRQLLVEGKVAATWEQDAKGGLVLRVKPGALTAAKEGRLLAFIERLLR